MNGKLFLLELRRITRDSRVRWLAATLAILFGVTFTVTANDVLQAATETREISLRERQRWLSQDPKNPHSAAHYGIWAFKLPATLSTLDPGIEPYVGQMVRVEAHRYNDALYRPAQDVTPISRAGLSTVAQVMQTLVPLACLLLAFGALAVDRERGTLRLALGNGADARVLLGARTLALLAVAGVATVLPTILLGVLSMLILEDAGTWSRLLALAGVNAAHAFVFVVLGMIMSSVARTSRSALSASVLVWVTLCIVGPRLATAYVEKVQPTPSYHAARMSAETEIKRYNAGELHQAREKTFTLLRDATSGAPSFDVRGAMLHDREQHDYRAFDEALAGFDSALSKQEQWIARLSLLSPSLAAQSASSAAAGVDLAHHTAFLKAVEGYRRTLSDTMNLDLRAHPGSDGRAYLAGTDVWSKVSAFEHRVPDVTQAIRPGMVALLSIVAWLSASLLALGVVARRLQP
jgi:ABC-2 type transport system permease protein